MQIKLNKFQQMTMSYWLKARVEEIGSRDIVDHYNDALWLTELLKGCVDHVARSISVTHVSLEEFEARSAAETAKCHPGGNENSRGPVITKEGQ